MDRLLIHKDTYYDSVFLMAVSAELAGEEGLDAAHVVLATPANVRLLADQGFDAEALAPLGPTDLVIALRAEDEATLERAVVRADALLSARVEQEQAESAAAPVGLEGGLQRLPGANLALISVPGAYAAWEAGQALRRGLNVMLFSDNVPLAREVALKEQAEAAGLLCMGPDCGTAVVDGLPLGFANRLRSGPVGLVGASGTGLQEIATLIHRHGGGVSQVLGTGGRDLHSEVGGRTTLAAIKLLAADAETEVLVVVSKPPAEEVAERVLTTLRALPLPSVVCFLGAEGATEESGSKVHHAATLRDAAALALSLCGGGAELPTLEQEVAPLLAGAPVLGPGALHGLYCGGTLCGEALFVLRGAGVEVGSNLDPGHELPDEGGHTVVDLGDDRFTRGRPHPMIDPEPRAEAILRLGSRPETALLLLDLVLGAGSHPDPAGVTAPAIAEARRNNDKLLVLASVTGTDLDAQNGGSQREALRRAGALVAENNAAAALCAAHLLRARGKEGR